MRLHPLLRLLPLLLPAIILLSGCSTGDPLDTLTGRGDVSDRIRDLFYPVFWIAVIVFFGVEGLLLFTIIRFRRRPGRDVLPKQTHGNTRLEIGWTIAPSLILAAIAVPTIATIVDLSETPKDAMPITVVAHQWWWEFQYRNPSDPSQTVYVANEMHIPVGRPVHVTIESVDVIHSFWVPNLAGKQDAVPNHQNDINIEARAGGVYQGQCAEFCLDSHALMRFLVIAEPQTQFDQWLAGQAQRARAPSGGSAARGLEVFMGNACIGCHAIEGTNAQGRIAPNLTHVGSRSTIGANRLENTPDHVEAWIKNPQAFKPGAKMPAWQGKIDDADIQAIVDYLESLK